MSYKRKHDTIDLTGEDSPLQSQRARRPELDQSQHDNWLDDSEAGAANDIIVSSHGDDDEIRLNFRLYGIINTRVVGVQYYNGYASEGE